MDHNTCLERIAKIMLGTIAQNPLGKLYTDIENYPKPPSLLDNDGNERIPDIMYVRLKEKDYVDYIMNLKGQSDIFQYIIDGGKRFKTCTIIEIKEPEDFLGDEERSKGQLDAYYTFYKKYCEGGEIKLIFTEDINIEIIEQLKKWGYWGKIDLQVNCTYR